MKIFNHRDLLYKLFCCTITVVCFASCTIHNQISREDYRSIPKDFSGEFNDQLDTIVSQYDNRMFTNSFMKQLSNIENIDYSKPIKINIKEKEMYISFEDVHAKQCVLKYYGKRQNNKFVFYINYQTISFPIVFISKEMEKYSIYISDNNELVFDNHSVNEGMLLLFGAGHYSNKDYKFKLL